MNAKMEVSNAVSDVVSQAEENVVRTKPWIVRLARLGYAAKGAVYFLVGLLAIQVAIGSGGETTDSEGALQMINRQPFGQVLLVLTAIGIFGYALWRLLQAWLDPDHHDSKSAKRIVQRLGYLVSALTYTFLGVEAVRLVIGGVSGGDNGTEDWTRRLMAQPFGIWLVGLVGLVIIAVGLFQIYYGIAAKFRDSLKLHQMSESERAWAMRSGRAGYSARGVIYAIIGGFLIWAARESNPENAGGMGEALDQVARQPYGAFLLALVAVGFMAYGFFAFVQARYRNIEVES